MNLYTTEIYAICPTTGDLKLWAGPHVPGISFADAQNYCETNGLGYCKVTGKLVAEINFKDNPIAPDCAIRVDYDNLN